MKLVIAFAVSILVSSISLIPVSGSFIPRDGQLQESFKGICPDFEVRCVKDGDWRNPIGRIGSKPFCREGIRCNQCEEHKNTRECNRTFKECEGECEAYGPIPF
ncbi:hypothetical protein I302_101082 [Kwoniella bestiolae CBS 10118]|uniref:Uncharacterized protein n=1 Tax=Kwoniella bestiolae CBS 10118 TaxID=1296100 RepID=A0A1B9G6V8_9TREE|nr:hypothetical protein I302_04458 [Kwoniella bestiolae CBS 10118]OCF26769.1 hypothetical protein I302_04458 [Kwoniella bestiolae CBS 10118]